MPDLSKMSNEELMKIAGVQQSQDQSTDLSSLSNSDLINIAGIQPTEKNLGLNTPAKKILPTFVTGAEPLPGERTVMGDVFERPAAAIRQGIRSAGEEKGLIGKTKGFLSGYQKGAILPEKVETFQEERIRKAQSKIIPKQGEGAEELTERIKKDKSGYIASTKGLALDYATNPADILVDAFGFGIGKMKKVADQGFEAAKKMSQIDKNYTKAVRPSVSGKKNAQQIKSAKENSRLAVNSILDNKNNLKFIDETGEAFTGRLPKDLNDFSQAIAQTKKQIFDEYTNLKRTAGEEMRVLFVDDIAKELRKSVENVAINDFAPNAKKAALEIADTLDKRGFYSVDEANDVLENLNQQLKAFYRNPDPKLVKENSINALVANKLRTKLDDVINEEGLGQIASSKTKDTFKQLKQRYGALKSIEDDVNRRLVVDARKNVRGLIDFTDVFTSQQLAEGLLTQNPVAITKAGIGFGLKTAIKRANDPNRSIEKMFLELENTRKHGKTIPRILSNPIIRRTPVAIQSLERERQKESGLIPH